MNLSEIARDSEVQRPTVQGFFEVLEDTLIVKRLEASETKLRDRERKKPKFYFLNPGIVWTLNKIRGPVAVEERDSLLEGMIFMLLSFQKDTCNEIDDIFYWSPAEAKLTDVDFHIRKGRELFAMEVKATERFARIT